MNEKKYEYELSIITVTYNAEKELEKTITSILSQKLENNCKIQYIIQDGLSKDGTLSVVEKHRFDFEKNGISLLVYSERDQGIYDAMNKGIQKATGKWICLLNAGDVFHDSTCLSNLLFFLSDCNADIVYADYCRINSYGKRYVIIPKLNQLSKTMIFCHQATIVHKRVYEKKKYNIQYDLVSDYDFFLNCYIDGKVFQHFKCFLIDYDLNGQSAINMVNAYKEIYLVRKNNCACGNNCIEKIVYILGLLKRRFLAIIPPWIRWPITFFVHNLLHK